MKNKLKLLLITVYFFCFNCINAQLISPVCATRTITTDWQNTSSSNLFNWTQSGLIYPVYLQDNLSAPSRQIELPYFCTATGGCGINTSGLYLQGNVAQTQDILPSQGWELMALSFKTDSAMIKEGINLGETQALQQQKIEELTLYSIQQNTLLQQQAAAIAAQAKKQAELEILLQQLLLKK